MSPRIDPDRFLSTPVGPDLFILDQRTGESFRLGGSGGRFWKLYEQGMSPQEAAAAIADSTGASLELVTSDALAFEAKLVDLGLADLSDP